MKYTNIKKLLIKFMGGGLINFPTRFLRWVKIDGDAEGDDGGDSGGGDSDSNVFFVPAYIQPKYFIDEDSPEPIEIHNYTSDIIECFLLYSKEDIISLGIEETSLNSLTQVTIDEAYEDAYSNSPTKGFYIDNEVFKNKIVLMSISKGTEDVSPFIQIYDFNTSGLYYLYKISDDIFLILEHTAIG